MKVASATAPHDFAALSQLNFSHSANYQVIELEAKKRAYARLYEQYKKLMEMEEHGISIKITMTSPAGTMEINGYDHFEPMEYLNCVSQNLNARAAEILELSAQHQSGLLLGTTEEQRAENALKLQAHALCMPQGLAEPAQTTPTSAPALAA